MCSTLEGAWLQPCHKTTKSDAASAAEGRIRRALKLFLALLTATTLATPARAQQADSLPDVRLEPHDGKTTFYLGEPIQLDLVFEGTGDPDSLKKLVYNPDRNAVAITPSTGWFEWHSNRGSSDVTTQMLIDQPTFHTSVQLDGNFIFQEPGQYRVRITTSGFKRKSDKAYLPSVISNEVTLDLRSMPTELEAATLNEILSTIANTPRLGQGYLTRLDALHRLATLQGDEALVEKLRLLESGDYERQDLGYEAFASTKNLDKQLELLQQVWLDPYRVPQYRIEAVLGETRQLLAERKLPSWPRLPDKGVPHEWTTRGVDENRTDLDAILDSMPRRQGQIRSSTAVFLVSHNGLSDTQRARAVDYAFEEFPHMDYTARHEVLEYIPISRLDDRFMPELRSMFASQPADVALIRALMHLAPDEADQWIAKPICSDQSGFQLGAFDGFAVDRVSKVDECLAARLRVAPTTPQEESMWAQQATMAARFATPAVLPALREGWKGPGQDSAALAILIRNDPTGAVELLNRRDISGPQASLLFYETHDVYNQLTQPFPIEVQTWLRAKLETGTDKELSTIAWAMSIGGDASDVPRVLHRLDRLHAQWSGSPLPADTQYAERELADTVLRFVDKRFYDEAQLHRLWQQCMAEPCRQQLSSWSKPETRMLHNRP